MKKVFITLITLIFIFSLTGCTVTYDTINVNVENSNELNNNIIGADALIEIGDNLYYDATTRIVYWWNGCSANNNATTPSPYYAPNGFPYRYNPETNTFEEIQINKN